MKLLPKDVARFWEKVQKGPGCWEWQASKQDFGHGLFRLNRRLEKAHRVSYVLHFGEIPEGLLVRHKCDNPSCVNPGHLEAGTHADNAQDRDSRGRHASAKQTHCKRGHLLPKDRKCKPCGALKAKRHYWKKKQCDS